MLADTGETNVTREAIVIVHLFLDSERMVKGASGSLIAMVKTLNRGEERCEFEVVWLQTGKYTKHSWPEST